MPDDWITTTEAARISGYHVKHIRRLMIAGHVKGRKFGPMWQVSKSSLLAYIHQAQQEGAKRGPKGGD